MTHRILPTLAAAALVVTLAGCSGKGTGDGGTDSANAVGVTDDTITLGVLTDESGPFKELGKGTLVGHEMWVDDVNKAGGVCGRDIKLEVRDHGYAADAGVLQFQELEPKVAGFLQVLGSSVNAALDADYESTKTTVVALSWSSFILKNPYVVVPGTTYDVEMINGLSHLLEEGQIKEGDTLGYVYLDGEYGENGLLGAEFFAKAHDIKLEKVKVVATDTDLRNIVTGLKGKGVKAIGLTTTPAQTASVATVSEQLGLEVPLIGNSPTFAPSILNASTAPALERYRLVASSSPFSGSSAKAKEIAKRFTEGKFDATANSGVPYGYAIGQIWQEVLENTCDDLSREGIQKALRASDEIDTDELVAPLDMSEVGAPATREVYIGKPDMDAPGGLVQVGDLFTSDLAAEYKAPAQK